MYDEKHGRPSNLIKETLLLFLPFILWIYLFRGFCFGVLDLAHDAPSDWTKIVYYLNSILNGQFPAWNPFIAWGSQDLLDIRLYGEFNPFLYFMALLKACGLSFYLSYSIFMIFYYFTGLLGFYLLARRLIGDQGLAWLAYILLMFSSLGTTLFTQPTIVLLTVPVLWFVFFLVSLCQKGGYKYILGAAFSLIIIVTTYIPFYFLTILLVYSLFFVIFYFKDLKNIFKKGFQSILSHKFIAGACLVALFLFLIPGVVLYKSTNDPQHIMATRHEGSPLRDIASMPIDTINVSGIGGFVTFQELFSDLDILKLQDAILCYIPILAFLIIFITMKNRVSKLSNLIFFSSLVLFLIALTDVAPIHKFLYDKIYFFKLFRNMYFFMYLLMPMAILFCAEQMRLLFKKKPQSQRRNIMLVAYVCVMHILFMAFLVRQENVMVTSGITVLLSLIVFGLSAMGISRNDKWPFVILLGLISIIQPIQFYTQFAQNSDKLAAPFPDERQKPRFSFNRPYKGDDPQFTSLEQHFGVMKQMKDYSGFVDRAYRGVRWSYLLHENTAEPALQNYVKHKFLAYDQVEYMDDSIFSPANDSGFKESLGRIAKSFKETENVAYVFDNGAEKGRVYKLNVNPGIKARILTEDSKDFKVLHFDLNSIKFETEFKSRKFLVYNDSFHEGWKALVNGKPKEIVRANVAFKGLWLEPGRNTVHMRYGSPLLRRFYVMLIGLMVGLFFFTLFAFFKDLFKCRQ